MNSSDLAGASLSALTQTNRPIKRVVGNETMCGFQHRLQFVSAHIFLDVTKCRYDNYS